MNSFFLICKENEIFFFFYLRTCGISMFGHWNASFITQSSILYTYSTFLCGKSILSCLFFFHEKTSQIHGNGLCIVFQILFEKKVLLFEHLPLSSSRVCIKYTNKEKHYLPEIRNLTRVHNSLDLITRKTE